MAKEKKTVSVCPLMESMRSKRGRKKKTFDMNRGCYLHILNLYLSESKSPVLFV